MQQPQVSALQAQAWNHFECAANLRHAICLHCKKKQCQGKVLGHCTARGFGMPLHLYNQSPLAQCGFEACAHCLYIFRATSAWALIMFLKGVSFRKAPLLRIRCQVFLSAPEMHTRLAARLCLMDSSSTIDCYSTESPLIHSNQLQK